MSCFSNQAGPGEDGRLWGVTWCWAETVLTSLRPLGTYAAAPCLTWLEPSSNSGLKANRNLEEDGDNSHPVVGFYNAVV